MSSKHAKENKLSITKIVCIIIICIAIIAVIIYFATKDVTKDDTKNITAETNTVETTIENTENPDIESNETSNEKTTPNNDNDSVANFGADITDDESKAIDLVKKHRGKESDVYYTIDGKKGDIYSVVVRNEKTTAAIMFYSVNITTGEVKEQ